MMFGLVISSLVKTAEKTMPLLVMFAIVQVVFTGCLFSPTARSASTQFCLPDARPAGRSPPPAPRWTSTSISPPWTNPASTDPLWEHTAGAWGMDMSPCSLLGVICGFFVARFLRRHEPEVMRK